MAEMTALADYVFLSSPRRSETFIVERGGRVRLYREGEAPGTPAERRKVRLPYLFDFREALPQPVVWGWLDGFLPVLQLTGADAQTMSLVADERGNLLVRQPSGTVTVWRGGGAEQGSEELFRQEIARRRDEWKCWFEAENAARTLDIPGKSCIVQTMCAFWNRHPKYGVEKYAELRADSFPPTICSMCECLALYGRAGEGRELLAYYLDRYLRADGTLDYYGPAISEYGDLLRLGALLGRGDGNFFREYHGAFQRIVHALLRGMNRWMTPGGSEFGLIVGVPEADTRDRPDEYLHCNLSVLRGFHDYREQAEIHLGAEAEFCMELGCAAEVLARRLKRFFAGCGANRLPPYRVSCRREIGSFCESLDAAYANYRYYPEMLQSGLLSAAMADAIVAARTQREGEEAGMTVFAWPGEEKRYDNWPIAAYGKGLLEYGLTEQYAGIVAGHLRHHMTPDTFTAYESVMAAPDPETGCRMAGSDWCVPAQLAYPILLQLPMFYHKLEEKQRI